MSNFSLKAFFGLDTSNLNQQLTYAGRRVQRFQSMLGAIGIAAGMSQVAVWFRDIVRHANESETGIDKNIDAIQRFSRQLDNAKKSAMDFGVAVVGNLNRAGESLGDFVSKVVFGMSQAEIDAANRIAKKQEEAKERRERERQRRIEISAEIRKMEDATDAAREKAAFERMSDLEKEEEIKRRIAAAEKDLAMAMESPAGGADVIKAQSDAALKVINLELQLEKLVESRLNKQADLERQINQERLDGYYAAMTEAEQLEELQQRLLDAERKHADLEGSGGIEEQAAYLEVIRLRNQVAGKERSITKERERIEKDIADKRLNTENQISKMIRDRTTASLSDLEGGGFGRGRASQARRVRQLEERAARARVRGNDELADRLAGRAGSLRDRIPGIRDSDRSAEQVMKSGFDETVSAVDKVTDAINKLSQTAD